MPDIKDASTKALVEELVKREGVSELWMDVNEPYHIESDSADVRDTGPARILIVID